MIVEGSGAFALVEGLVGRRDVPPKFVSAKEVKLDHGQVFLPIESYLQSGMQSSEVRTIPPFVIVVMLYIILVTIYFKW